MSSTFLSSNTPGWHPGVKAQGGSARVAAATELIESVGGKLDHMYFAFGDTDVYCVADLPDNVSAVAVAQAVSAGGGLRLGR